DETIEGQAEGGTEGYLSPEQAVGGGVGRGADVWSWGLTVLAMFAGGRTWVSGTTLAVPVLDRLIERGATVEIPPFVADLLRRCFNDDPGRRPHSLREAVRPPTQGERDDALDTSAGTSGQLSGRPAPRSH